MTGTLKLLNSPSLLRSCRTPLLALQAHDPTGEAPRLPHLGCWGSLEEKGGHPPRNQFSVAGVASAAYLWLVPPLSHRVTFLSPQICMIGSLLYSLISHSPIVCCLWGFCSRTAPAPALLFYLPYVLINGRSVFC